MQRVIAVDRTERRVRYVLGDLGARSQVVIRAAGTVEIAEDVSAVTVELGKRLRELLVEHKATKSKLLMGLGRGAVESVEFSVPAAEESELPALVRNLTMRHLSHVSEDSDLDFLTSSPRPDGSRDVIAMTVRDEVRPDLEVLMKSAETPTAGWLVRPYELTAFLAEEALSQVVLLVCSSAQMVDVLLMHPQGGTLARSIRTAETASPSASAAQVVNEIRRTLIALPVEDFDATHLDRILLLAGPEELQPLATDLGTALDAPVERYNPFAEPNLRMESAPFAASEYAPLVGMLLNEARGRHPVDFRNPRRPPQPMNRRKAALAAVVAAAALVGSAAYFINGQFAEIDGQNARLAAEVRELKELSKEVQPKLRLARALQSWEKSRISWLDELRDLTLRMPPSRDLTVQRLTASPSRSGAAVTFSGESRAPEIVARMEHSLRDQHHQPKTPGVRERPTQDRPVWSFQTTMTVQARSADEYTVPEFPIAQGALAASPSDAVPTQPSAP